MYKLILVLVLLLPATAWAQQRGTFYGPGGEYLGSYQRFGNVTTFYGPGGGYRGSAFDFGSVTTFHGAGGGYEGSRFDRPQRPHHYLPRLDDDDE